MHPTFVLRGLNQDKLSLRDVGDFGIIEECAKLANKHEFKATDTVSKALPDTDTPVLQQKHQRSQSQTHSKGK